MIDINVKYVDRKGEPGQMHLPCADTPVEANILAVLALSYIGADAYSQTVETAFVSPQAVDSTDLVENDRDFKCLCSFKGASGYFRISWPAPKINIEAGFVIRYGQNRAFVPPSADVGETGNDGTDVAELVKTLTGDATVTFKSGRISKRS